jgi:hypothetical protein
VEGRFEREQAVRAFGVVRTQVYFRADPDGLRLLPACWDLAKGTWRELSDEPAQALATGMPSSRTSACHGDRDVAWAAGVVSGWRRGR